MSSTIVKITEKARAVLVFDEELTKVIKEIEAEKRRHHKVMKVLLTNEQALKAAIFKVESLHII